MSDLDNAVGNFGGKIRMHVYFDNGVENGVIKGC